MTFFNRRSFIIGGGATAGLVAAAKVTAESARALRDTFTPYRFPETMPVSEGTAAKQSVDFALGAALHEAEKNNRPLPDIIEIPSSKQTLRFTCDLEFHDKATGARAFAFRPVDATGARGDELRLLFPGRSHGLRSTPQENKTAIAIFKGERSPQIPALKQFQENELFSYLEKNPGLKVHIFGHSLETSLALNTKDWLDRKAVPVQTNLFEPFAAAHEAGFIMRDHPDGTKSADERDAKGRQLLGRLRKNISTLYSFPPTMIRELQVGSSTVGNMLFGDEVLVLNGSKDGSVKPTDPYRASKVEGAVGGAFVAPTIAAGAALLESRLHHKPFSRRTFLRSTPALMFATLPLGAAGGGLIYEALHEELHERAVPASILMRSGDAAIARCTNTHQLVASDEQILHPRDYPLPTGDYAERILAQIVTGGLSII